MNEDMITELPDGRLLAKFYFWPQAERRVHSVRGKYSCLDCQEYFEATDCPKCPVCGEQLKPE